MVGSWVAREAVDLDELAGAHLDPRLVEPRHRGVGPAADGHEHAIERVCSRATLWELSLERHGDAVADVLDAGDLGEQHALAHRLDALREDVDEVAIGAGQQAVGHLDDGDLRSSAA